MDLISHLHGVDSCLSGRTSQRASHEPLMWLDFPTVFGQQLLILLKHNPKHIMQDWFNMLNLAEQNWEGFTTIF